MSTIDGVKEIHDLHIWAMSTTETALTAHLIVEKFPVDNKLVETINIKLHDDFRIEHPTIQIELMFKTNNCEKCR